MSLLSSSPLGNFYDLRKEGIKALEVLSSAKWDDFNAHDPGITILEELCLALTELGLKANADVPDLIAQSGTKKPFLPPAQSILTNDALTDGDYQKIIADTTGVQRGWYVHNPLPHLVFFFNRILEKLSYDSTDADVIRLKGLFDVYFQPQRPDLVGNILRGKQTLNGLSYYVEIAFPYWSDFPDDWHTTIAIDPGGITITDTSTPPLEDLFFVATIKVAYNTGAVKDFPGIIRLTPLEFSSTPVNRALIWNDLEAWLTDETDVDNIVVALSRSVADIAVVHRTLTDRLQETRNLCTDILSTSPIRIQEVSINTELEIGGVPNLEEMIAHLYLRVEEMISPRVVFQDFPSVPGISEPALSYEGPLLKKGVLTGNQFTGKAIEALYTSDFVNVMLKNNEVPEQNIISISDLYLTNYLNNYVINPIARNCLKLANPDVYRVKFSAVKSIVKLFKEGSEVTYNKSKVLQYFFELLSDKYREREFVNPPSLLPSRITAFDFNTYSSIQRDFPEVYGIDEGEIPVTAPVSRISEARQLKGYLLFFEQPIANATAQTTNASRLFDLDPNLSTTRFTLPLYDVPDVWALLKHYSGYSHWEDFINDRENGYVSGIRNIAEDKISFLRRRAAFLDHVLARFGEDIHEYANVTLSYYLGLEKDLSKLPGIREDVEEKLILDRIRLLKDLPAISSGRARGMHFREVINIFEVAPGTWNWKIVAENGGVLLTGTSTQTTRVGAFDNLFNNLHLILNPGYVQVVTIPSNQIKVFDNQILTAATVVAVSPTFASPALAIEARRQLAEQVELVWGNDNISGLERRVGRLLGFSDIRRRNLVHVDISSASIIKTNGAQFAISLTPPEIFAPLHTDYVFPNATDAANAIPAFIRAGIDIGNYTTTASPGLLTITLTDPTSTLTAKATLTPDENSDAERIIKNMAYAITAAFGPQEGVFVIEHLLLRPTINSTTGAHEFIIIPDAPEQIWRDPYSYQVTVVIPDGTPHDVFATPATVPSRFADPTFRSLIKKTIQLECPSHIMPRILVLDVNKMAEVQKRYCRWIMLSMSRHSADDVFAFIQNELILSLTTP